MKIFISCLSFSQANKFGFKPIIIDPLSHPVLCSQLLKCVSSMSISTQISLYSIDCVRKIFQTYHYAQREIFDLLDVARLAEANDDITFWDNSYEVKKIVFYKVLHYISSYLLDFINQHNE